MLSLLPNSRSSSPTEERRSGEAMIEVRVSRKSVEAQDVHTFELVDVSGLPLPPFSAGAHIDVEVAPGLIRQYSLCNDANEVHRYTIGVLRDPNSRGGSSGMHDRVAEGSRIRISPPRNHFPLVQGAKRSLLFAGGIGVTPLLCMAERLGASGEDFEMHYCLRTEARAAFRDRILESSFAESVHFHYDDGDAQQKVEIPELLATPDPETHIYVCGPAGFLDFVLLTAKTNGWSSANVHYEYFGGKTAKDESDSAFHVKVASSGKIIPVAADQSVVEALLICGIEVPMSCEQGVCGTCVTRVLDGTIDHRDMYFTDSEKALNNQFTPCCSRAKSDVLVLDL